MTNTLAVFTNLTLLTHSHKPSVRDQSYISYTESEKFEACSQPIPIEANFCTNDSSSIAEMLSIEWEKLTLSIEEPPKLDLKKLPEHLEYDSWVIMPSYQ